MNFRETNEYLLSLGNEVSAMKLGLENIRRLLDALGNPQKNYLKVQVAGTNGKGSVCAFLNSICLQAGIKAGVFTSPHLVSITERMNIGGIDISENDFAKFATRVRKTAEALVADGEIDAVPTFFEQVTAVALLAFAEAKVELAILETGLGGRLDATTAASAEIAAITRIDYDHQQYLGNTIQEIAGEKAAIIHEGSKVVIGEQQPSAMAVIRKPCQEFGITPGFAEQVSTTCGSGWLSFETARQEYKVEKLGLPGHHQIENAKIAIALTEVLQDHFPMIARNIVAGLETARHPGRLEFIRNILLDGAHNVSGAKALKAFLDEFVDKPITLVFGVMNDKDVGAMAEILFPKANRVILTQADNSRAMPVEQLIDRLQPDFTQGNLVLTNSASDALSEACELSGDEGVIVVTGSLYLVGDVKKILNN